MDWGPMSLPPRIGTGFKFENYDVYIVSKHDSGENQRTQHRFYSAQLMIRVRSCS